MTHWFVGAARTAGVAVLVAITSCGPSAVDEPATPDAGGAEVSPVVVDGDFGPDDMMALLYLLQRPDLDVVSVTVTGTGLAHCPQGAANARAVLDHLGHTDIPVACGPDAPLEGANAFPEEWRSGSDGFVERIGLDPYGGSVADDAVDLLIDTVLQSEQPVHIVVLGPMTNVALALEQEPAMPARVAGIVAMGGAFDVGGSVAPEHAAEWNIWVDPAAANVVLESGVPVSIVPLDATNHVPATAFFFETLGRAKDTAEARLIYRFLATHDYNLVGGAYFFWDPLAAVALVEPEVVGFETMRVTVDGDNGATVESADGVEVQVAMSADRRAFEEEFLTVVNGGSFVAADIPEPEIIVRLSGDGCSFEGTTELVADGPLARVVLELVNETEVGMAVVAGTHDGATWEQLLADGATYQQTGVAPDYWMQTGVVELYGKSITGGTTVAALELAPGTHALLCTNEENAFWPLTDISIAP